MICLLLSSSSSPYPRSCSSSYVSVNTSVNTSSSSSDLDRSLEEFVVIVPSERSFIFKIVPSCHWLNSPPPLHWTLRVLSLRLLCHSCVVPIVLHISRVIYQRSFLIFAAASFSSKIPQMLLLLLLFSQTIFITLVSNFHFTVVSLYSLCIAFFISCVACDWECTCAFRLLLLFFYKDLTFTFVPVIRVVYYILWHSYMSR
jgi:hypothetical protein